MVAERILYDSKKHCLSDVFLEDKWTGKRQEHFWKPKKSLKAD